MTRPISRGVKDAYTETQQNEGDWTMSNVKRSYFPRQSLLAGGARLNSFIFGSLVGRFLFVGILLWCSAFLSSHSFRDFFLRAGTGLSCFYRRRNLIPDRADHSRTGGPSGSRGRSSSIGNFAGKRFGFFSRTFPRGYHSFLHTCYNGLLCFYRCRNLIQNHTGRSRTGGPGRSSSIGNFASKRFGSFSGAFLCSYNSFLRTRYDALTRHFHSSMAVVERPSRSVSN
jgi:hypothetical protein